MYSKYCPPNNVEVDAKSMFILYLLNRRTKIKLLRIVEGRTHIIFRNAKANRIFVKVYKSKREMKFFIDTANLEQIREAQDLGILDGVTTNPSLMAKEGISGAEGY